jgi:hypothetical protein
MGSITEKEEEEALFTSKKKGSFRRQERFKPKWTDGDKYHAKERSPSLGGARGREGKKYQPKKQNGGCFNCGKASHFARDCRLPKRCFEGNIATIIKEEKNLTVKKNGILKPVFLFLALIPIVGNGGGPNHPLEGGPIPRNTRSGQLYNF